MNEWRVEMPGIPGPLLASLRDTLSDCDEFENYNTLKAVFVHELLVPWRKRLRSAGNPLGLADETINLLWQESRSDTKTNALVLLLIVLRDRYKPDTDLYERLDGLARDLEQALQANTPPANQAYIVEQANPETRHMLFTAEWLKLLASIQAVGKVSVPQVMNGRLTKRFPQGTGWLIAPNLAMTCWHTIRARSAMDKPLRREDLQLQVTNSMLTFDYTRPAEGVGYKIDTVECYSHGLDYALLRLRDRSDSPLRNRGFLKLDVELPMTSQTDFYIIQHPKGQPQQQASGRFERSKQGQPDRILHNAPAEAGTSGAPVLNVDNWQVVALHSGEDQILHLREAILLKAILSDVKQARPDLYSEIINAR